MAITPARLQAASSLARVTRLKPTDLLCRVFQFTSGSTSVEQTPDRVVHIAIIIGIGARLLRQLQVSVYQTTPFVSVHRRVKVRTRFGVSRQ
jgi:hypothetical protein